MTSVAIPKSNPLRRVGAGLGAGFGRFGTGIVAVGAKELRGRMRGRRAFAVLTLYLVLLAAFAWGIYDSHKTAAEAFVNLYGGTGGAGSLALSAQIGQALFSALLVVETLLILVLAPAFTSGAISLEREKQALDLLVVTPLSSFALVVGKLLAALAYVFLLILASVPLAAVVFLFGGVGPEDLVRGYVLLFSVAIGFGAIGLFASALVRRTQVATVAAYLTVLTLTMGTALVWDFGATVSGFFWGQSTVSVQATDTGAPGQVTTTGGGRAQQILWLNPFVADLDLICGTSSSGYDKACAVIGAVTGKPYFGATFGGGGKECPANARCAFPQAAPGQVQVGRAPDCPAGKECGGGNPGIVADDVLPGLQQTVVGLPRDSFWPQSAAAFLVTALILTFLSSQLVAPTRRLFHLPRRRRRAPEATA